MADIKAERPGTAGNGGKAQVMYHDEADGTYSMAEAAHVRGWDATDSSWYRLPVDHGTGALQVYIAGGGGSGGTSATDGASYTAGSSAGTPLMAARDDAATSTLAEDKIGIVRATTNRALHVNLRDASGNEVAVGGGTQYVEDAAAASDPTGTVPILVRKDTPAATVTTDGDNIAQRGTNYGAAYVTLLDTSGSAVSVGGGTQYAEDAASAGGESMTLAGAVRQDTLGSNTTTDGDYTYLKTTSAGRLYASATVDAALPAGANAIGKLAANDGVDIGDVTVNNASGGSAVNIQDGGNSITVDGSVTVTQATATNLKVDASGVAVPVTDNSGSLTVDAPVGTPAFVRLSDGAAAITALPVTDNGGSLTVDGTVAVSGTVAVTDNSGSLTVDAPVGTPVFVTSTPSTSGGWSVFNATSGDGSTALTSTAQQIKGTAGTLGGWYIYNPNSSAVYVPIYNVVSASVTVGTTNPAMVLAIPATSAANLELANGIQFGTAISIAAATTAAGNTAPGTALEANFFYK